MKHTTHTTHTLYSTHAPHTYITHTPHTYITHIPHTYITQYIQYANTYALITLFPVPAQAIPNARAAPHLTWGL